MPEPEPTRRSDLLSRLTDSDDPPHGTELAVLLSRGIGPIGPGSPVERTRWGHVVMRVTSLNAQISLLRYAAAQITESADPELRSPASIQISGQNLRRLECWCDTTERDLLAMRLALRKSTLTTALRRLVEREPALDTRVLQAAGALVSDHADSAGLLQRQVRRRLDAMAAEAPLEKTERALELGAKAVAARSRVAARSYADQLISLVLRTNAECDRQGGAALTAAHYLQALGAVPSPFSCVGRVMSQLTEILAGSRRFSDELYETAERLRCRAEETAERALLAEVLTGVLGARGFTVRSDWDLRPPAVVITASRGTHRGHLLIDDHVVLGGLDDMPAPTPGFVAEIRGIDVPVDLVDRTCAPRRKGAGD